MCSRLDKKSIILLVYVLKNYFEVVMPMCCLMYTFIHHEGSKSTVKIKIKTDRHTVHIQKWPIQENTYTKKMNFNCLKHNY